MYPALAIRQALGNDANPILWVGSEGGMEADLVQRAGMSFTAIPSGQVAGMGLRIIPNLVKVIQGTLVSQRILNDFKPDVLLFTGGYVAVPMALAGRNIPSLVYVPDIEPGIALKLMARFASIIGLTSENSRQYFPNSAHTEITGYPIRADLKGWTREKALAHLGLNPDRFILLVTGGSSGARSLNRALLAALPDLLHEIQIIHLIGKLDWAEVQAALPSLTSEMAENYHPLPYLHEMGAALAAADLVISRAGASTLGELPLFGLPAILVPYPHAWRYQKVNADYLIERGAALMIEDAKLPEMILTAVLTLSRDPDRLQRMRQAMQSLVQPQAGQRLADIIRELAKGPSMRKKSTGHLEDTSSGENLHG
ncbi:MAG: UDP-N-acetylglucosamine--N-acetylmuramyl-(pentapeptide) pyrophosphoryl-undecaprenol N-acetylglucosamine transferase [Anaerolineaceae bacterium]|nr:UDP-N-acetylglucosamine--N-acetylmuramyl-(pentapeptide) pyrophosphoryl-undecaprenol N-acetylglucosamine transferase [Anaerolineaceae bacterium]